MKNIVHYKGVNGGNSPVEEIDFCMTIYQVEG
jgi:hypothetical protein